MARPQFAQSSEDDDTVIVVSDNELPISVRCRDDLGELGNVKLFAPKNLLHHKKESYARSFTADDNGIQLRLDATCDGKQKIARAQTRNSPNDQITNKYVCSPFWRRFFAQYHLLRF